MYITEEKIDDKSTNSYFKLRCESLVELGEAALDRSIEYSPFEGGSPDWIGRDFETREDGTRIRDKYERMRRASAALNEHWQEGMDCVTRFREQLESALPAPESRRRRKVWSETDGDEVCNDRLRAGQTFWRGSRRAHSGPNTVVIVCNCANNCNVDPERILWRAAAATATAELLENAGYRTEIWGVAHIRNCWRSSRAGDSGYCHGMFYVRCKDAYQPLDASAICNSLSGWCFRTSFFRLMGHEHRKFLERTMGLGHSETIWHRERLLDAEIGGNNVPLLLFENDVLSFQQAVVRAEDLLTSI